MSKPPLRRILASQRLAAASYRLTADTGATFIVEDAGEELGWRWYHEGDDPAQPARPAESGHFTREECLDSLRGFLEASPRQQPRLRIRGLLRPPAA